MKKNGFSLVELLAVIVILSIIMSMAGFGVMRIRNNSLNDLLNSKKKDLVAAAILYGQDNQDKFKKCQMDEVDSYCAYVTVEDLIKNGYYTSKETNSKGAKDLINNVTNKSMLCDEIVIYKKNNRVYAKFNGELLSNTSEVCNKGGI